MGFVPRERDGISSVLGAGFFFGFGPDFSSVGSWGRRTQTTERRASIPWQFLLILSLMKESSFAREDSTTNQEHSYI